MKENLDQHPSSWCVTAIEVEQIVSEDLDVQMEEYFIFLMRSVRFEK